MTTVLLLYQIRIMFLIAFENVLLIGDISNMVLSNSFKLIDPFTTPAYSYWGTKRLPCHLFLEGSLQWVGHKILFTSTTFVNYIVHYSQVCAHDDAMPHFQLAHHDSIVYLSLTASIVPIAANYDHQNTLLQTHLLHRECWEILSTVSMAFFDIN